MLELPQISQIARIHALLKALLAAPKMLPQISQIARILPLLNARQLHTKVATDFADCTDSTFAKCTAIT
jgi:hypothetical protein